MVVTQSMSGMLGFAQTGPRSLGMKGTRLGITFDPFLTAWNLSTNAICTPAAPLECAGAVGRVSQKFDVEVSRGKRGPGELSVIDPEYRKLSRQRAQQAAKKTRTTQLISQPQITNLRQPVEIGIRKKARDLCVGRFGLCLQSLFRDVPVSSGRWRTRCF